MFVHFGYISLFVCIQVHQNSLAQQEAILITFKQWTQLLNLFPEM